MNDCCAYFGEELTVDTLIIDKINGLVKFNIVMIISFGIVSALLECFNFGSAHTKDDDVVIAFSFPRYSAATVKGAQYCRTTGAKVIGITDSRLSPLGQHCDHVLLAKSDMVSLVDSLVAPLSVVNALIVALAAGREQALSKTFDTLERVWDEYNVYEKQVDTK